MKENNLPIEPGRIIDEDIYDLLITLRSCKDKFIDVCRRLEKAEIREGTKLDNDFHSSIDEAIVYASALAQDALIHNVNGEK